MFSRFVSAGGFTAALVLSSLLVSASAHATAPASGTLNSTDKKTLTATGGPYVVNDPVGNCTVSAACDIYALTVDLPADYLTGHPNDRVKVDLKIDDGASDLDLDVLDSAGQSVGSSGNGPGVNETLSFAPKNGSNKYSVRVKSFSSAGTTAHLTIALIQSTATTPVDPCVQAGTATTGGAVLGPDVAKDLSSLPVGAAYGAFVHFSMGSDVQHRELISTLGLTFGKSFYPWANSIYVTGPVSAFIAIAKDPSVSYIEPNTKLHYTADTDVWATRVRVAQEPVSGGPYYDGSGHILDGTGTTISVVDSGLFGAHPDFAGRILHNYVIEGNSAASTPPQDVGYTNSDTTGGHGTHCNGISAGDGTASDPMYPMSAVAPIIKGTYTGVAPKAKLWAYGVGQALVVLGQNQAFMDILAQYNSTDPNRIRVISNSYGATGGTAYNPADTSSCLVKSAIKKGMSVVFAASNDGGDGTVDKTSPACKDPTPGVICVASYNDAHEGNLDHPLSSFSSRGQNGKPETYPDIAAPGDEITATCLQPAPGQGVCATGAETKWQPYYGTISGTSMATPHTAGAIALLYQAKPDLSPAQMELLIQNTARKAGGLPYEKDPQNPDGTVNYGYGAGLLDLPAALNKLGIRKAGLTGAGQEFTVFDGDTDSTVDGAADVQKLTMTESATGVSPSGVTFKLTLGATDVTTGAVTYSVHYNAAGHHFDTAVAYDGTKVSIPETGSGNTAVAKSAGVSGKVISLFVPYSQMGYPAVTEPIHNIRVSSQDASGNVEDWAPSPMGTNANSPGATQAGNNSQDKYPVYGRAFTVQQSAGAAPPSTERTCVYPGLTVLTSPSGGTATGGSNLPTGQDDLLAGYIAEPKEMPGKLVFTIKVTDISTVPPGYRWYMYFNLPGDKNNYFVALDGSSMSYIYGTRGSTADTTGDLPEVGGVGVFTTMGTLDNTSGTDAKNGLIKLVLDKTVLKIAAGTVLTNVAASIRQTTNPQNGSGLTADSASAAYPYTVVGNDVCAAAASTSAGSTTGATTGSTTGGGTTTGTTTTGSTTGSVTPVGGVGTPAASSDARLGGGGAVGLWVLIPGLLLAARRRRTRR